MVELKLPAIYRHNNSAFPAKKQRFFRRVREQPAACGAIEFVHTIGEELQIRTEGIGLFKITERTGLRSKKMSLFWSIHKSGNAKRDMFRLQECIHAFDAEFSPPTTLLDASERRLAGRRQPIIDPNNPGFERFRQTKHSPEVTRKGIGAQAIRRIVRPCQRLRLSLERCYRRNWRKRLLLHTECSLGCIGQNGWFEKIPGSWQGVSPAHQSRATTDCILYMFNCLGQGFAIDQGPRSEEHTSELQSPYVISYAVFCLKT